MKTVPYSRTMNLIEFRDAKGIHEVEIGAGSSDDVHVFREGEHTYILSLNRRLDYAGLDVYESDEKVGDNFVQEEMEIKSILGPKGLDLAPINIAKGMANWFWETHS